MKRLRTRAENGTGVWEHATPEERAARVKTLEDQIHTVADHAMATYDHTKTSTEPVDPNHTEPTAPHAEGTPDPDQAKRSTTERNQQLAENKELSTAQAHATITLPEGGNPWEILKGPGNWTPERAAFHKQTLDKAVADAMKFAEEMRAAHPDADPTIFAMRGNTAAGKSRSIAAGGAPEIVEAVGATKGMRHRANNPDNFKQEIYENAQGVPINSTQAHLESSILSDAFHERMLEAKLPDGSPADMLIDKRLAKLEDTTKLLAEGKKTGRSVALLDVDADLPTSLAGVLDRNHGGEDPIPPFKAISDGFQGVRGNRLETINAIASEPTASYRLMGTNPDGSKTLIAEIKPLAKGEPVPSEPLDRLVIHDDKRFNEMIPSGKEVASSASATASQVITPEVISKLVGPLEPKYGAKLRAKLEGHLGETWQQAVDNWSAQTPPTTGAPVQRKSTGDDSVDGVDHAEVARAGTSGSGGSLPHQETIQRSFGRHDVSGVRAHVGGKAAESSKALGAKAYAHGDAVAFAGSPDLHTAAHEAAHVIQQRAGVSVKGGIDGGSGDEHEKHADAVADAVVSGGSAEALLDTVTGSGAGEAVQRKSVANPVIQRKGDAASEVISHEMGTDKGKAASMLAKTPPENRGTVEAIIRSKFKKEDADEIISKTASTGSAPKPKSAGAPKKTNAGADAKGKKGAAAAKHSKMPTRGASHGGRDQGRREARGRHQRHRRVQGRATSDLALIHQELIEHEEWKAAKDQVGDAGSVDRASFIAEQTGKGVFGAGSRAWRSAPAARC